MLDEKLQLVDVYEDANHLHLVTELCTGGELFDRYIYIHITCVNSSASKQ
jgi:hypothetical protein